MKDCPQLLLISQLGHQTKIILNLDCTSIEYHPLILIVEINVENHVLSWHISPFYVGVVWYWDFNMIFIKK